VLYVILFVVILKNSLEVLRVLRNHFQMVQNNASPELIRTLKLKISMTRTFVLIIQAFFLFEIVVHGFLPFLNTSSHFDSFATVFHQVYDFLINLALLVNFRPRHWPEYFGLGILDDNNLAGSREELGVQRQRLVPLVQAEFYEDMKSGNNYFSSLDSNDPVVVLNPDASFEESSCSYQKMEDEEPRTQPRLLKRLQVAKKS